MQKPKYEVIQGLREILGEEAFRKLLTYAGDTFLWIPSIDSFYREDRNIKMRKLYKAGWSAIQLAEHFGVHPSTVYYVVGNYSKTRKKREEKKYDESY